MEKMVHECPFCHEAVNFDLKKNQDKAKKCPHCHELIHPESWLGKIERGIVFLVGKSIKSKCANKFIRVFLAFLISTIIAIAVALLPRFLKMELWPASWIMAAVIFLLTFLILTRPLNMQSAIIISFVTLIFVGLGNLWQKENFELRNRPYIQIRDSTLSLRITGAFRLNNPTARSFNKSEPEPQFQLILRFLNHGPVPASISKLKIKGHSDKHKLFSTESINFGPDPAIRQAQWINIDVFPYISAGGNLSNIYEQKKVFYLNVNDIKQLFGLDISKEDILKNVDPKQNQDGVWRSPYLNAQLNQGIKPYYLLAKLEYYALGENDKGKQPYRYWAVYKVDAKQAFAGVELVESGIDLRR